MSSIVEMPLGGGGVFGLAIVFKITRLFSSSIFSKLLQNFSKTKTIKGERESFILERCEMRPPGLVHQHVH